MTDREHGRRRARLPRIVCGVCADMNDDYTQTAVSCTVKSGQLRILTWLCPKHMAQAESAQAADVRPSAAIIVRDERDDRRTGDD